MYPWHALASIFGSSLKWQSGLVQRYTLQVLKNWELLRKSIWADVKGVSFGQIKGQIISKGLFVVLEYSQKTNE